MPVCLATSVIVAGYVVGYAGCSRRTVGGKEDIPRLKSPITIVDGALWGDGGSATVTLRGHSGTQLDLVVTQSTFPTDNYQPNCLYLGTLDGVHDGRGSLCPRGSDAAEQIAEYLEDAITNADPSWSVVDSDFDEHDRPLSTAQRVLKFLKPTIPAIPIGNP
jgi:hypothetical protein